MHPLDNPELSRRYFFPRAEPPPPAHLVEVNGLNCARVHQSDALPTVLYFHGNGEVVADHFPDIARALASAGCNLFFAEYRGYGGSRGAPDLVTMLDDVGPLVDASGATHVFGRSVGSIYAIEAVAARPQLASLTIESGIHSVLERILARLTPQDLGFDDEEALAVSVDERFDHAKKLGDYRGRVLVMHADHDHLVGVHHAEANAAAARDAELVRFSRGDHNSIFAVNAAEYLEVLQRWFAAL